VLHGKVSGQDVDAVRHEAESRVR